MSNILFSAYLYHPRSDACWPAWRQGPCAQGHVLVLPPNSVLPVCEKNPCETDGLVQHGGKCERLGSIKPCAHLYPISAALGIHAGNMTVVCVRLSLESRFGEDVVPVLCPPGCKRSINGKCVPVENKQK